MLLLRLEIFSRFYQTRALPVVPPDLAVDALHECMVWFFVETSASVARHGTSASACLCYRVVVYIQKLVATHAAHA